MVKTLRVHVMSEEDKEVAWQLALVLVVDSG